MKRSEWVEAVALLRVNWPHARLDDAVIAKWYRDLAHLPSEQVIVAIEAIYRDGREFPPNAAQILGKIAELANPMIDHGEAWRLAKTAALKADPLEAQRWLEERSPEAAEAVRRISGAQLSYLHEDEPTVRAQFRDIFRGIVEARRRDERYAGLPSAGLRGLESGPRRLGGALRRALPERAS